VTVTSAFASAPTASVAGVPGAIAQPFRVAALRVKVSAVVPVLATTKRNVMVLPGAVCTPPMPVMATPLGIWIKLSCAIVSSASAVCVSGVTPTPLSFTGNGSTVFLGSQSQLMSPVVPVE
jgi:hypothetical protein